MQMTGTPFEILQKKDKDRKNALLKIIEEKDLKNKTINYNIRKRDETNADKDEHLLKNHLNNSCEKEDKPSVNMMKSLKKSFFYRKLLNKSSQNKLTSEDFYRFKEQFNNLSTRSTQNNSFLYRELYEQQKNSQKQERQEINFIVQAKQKSSNPLQDVKDKKHNKMQENIFEQLKSIQKSVQKHQYLEIVGNNKKIKKKNYISIKPATTYQKQSRKNKKIDKVEENEQKGRESQRKNENNNLTIENVSIEKLNKFNTQIKLNKLCTEQKINEEEAETKFLNKFKPYSSIDKNDKRSEYQNEFCISKYNKNVFSLKPTISNNGNFECNYEFRQVPETSNKYRKRSYNLNTPIVQSRRMSYMEEQHSGRETYSKVQWRITEKKPTVQKVNDIKGWNIHDEEENLFENLKENPFFHSKVDHQ